MYALGVIVSLGVAVAFAVVGILLVWGALQTLRGELLPGFVSANPSGGDRALRVFLLIGPLCGAAILSLLAAGRFVLVALGMG